MKRIAWAIGCVAGVGTLCLAVTTSYWEISSASELAKGTLHGVMISSTGEVLRGLGLDEHKVDDKAIWSMGRSAAGKIYIGTGPKGLIQVLGDDGKFTTVHETKEMAVTCFAAAGPNLFCGTMPGGKIFKIGADGKAAEFVKLDCLYVWGLAADKNGTLYAATGPDGKLFRIKPDGTADVFYKSKETNLLSVAVSADGSVLCGSGDHGLLLRVKKKNKARVLYDFAELEVRSIVVEAPDAQGRERIIVGANSAGGGGKKSGGDDDAKAVASAAEALLKRLAPEPPKGSADKTPPSTSGLSGTVYRLDAESHLEVLFKTPGEFIWQIALLGTRIAVATGNAGRVHVIEPKTRLSYVAVDLPASQIMGLLTDGAKLTQIAAANGAAVHTVLPAGPDEAYYLSDVLDAQFSATWGKLSHVGRGRLTFQTRSGMTREPDETWSEWSGEIDSTPFRVTSPRARHLQLRVNLNDPDSALTRFRVAYLVDNQRPLISELTAGQAKGAGGKGSSKGSAAAASAKGKPGPAQPRQMIRWKAADADGDRLIYRLYYKREADENWRAVLNHGRTLTTTQHQWDTSSIPDGRYLIKLVASDEQANPVAEARSDERVSEHLLIDHTSPVVQGLVVDRGRVLGRARDEAGIITYLAYNIDGGEWKIIYPADRLFDDREETFSIILPDDLAPGSHTAAVKAIDAAGNSHISAVSFHVRGKK